MFTIDEKLLTKVAPGYFIKYHMYSDDEIGLCLSWGDVTIKPKEVSKLPAIEVNIKHVEDYIELNGEIIEIQRMMMFLPTLIRDFAVYHNIINFIPVKCYESLSLYVNTAVNFVFMVPYLLLAKKYPNLRLHVNTLLNNVLTFAVTEDKCIIAESGPYVNVSFDNNYPTTVINLTKKNNRITFESELITTDQEHSNIMKDIAHTIIKVNEMNVSMLIALVKSELSKRKDFYTGIPDYLNSISKATLEKMIQN